MTLLERRIERMEKALAEATSRLASVREYPEVLSSANLCEAVKKLPALASEINAVLFHHTFPVRKKGDRK
jgi:hypothetical protein